MKNVLFIFLIYCFSLTIISCSSSDDGSKSTDSTTTDDDSTTTDNDSTTTDDNSTTDETAGFSVSSISGSTTEAGGTSTFTVKLNSQPTANVTIGVSSSDTSEGTVSPSSLTFTSANYNENQTVTVTGVNDSLHDGNQSYTIVLSAANSSDSDYNGMNPTDVTVSNTDDYITCNTITTTDSDITAPTFVSSTPADYEHSVPITSNISVTFSETMNTSSVTDNTLDTVCYGTFMLSTNIWETCIQLNDPPAGSNNDKTFTITPKNNLLNSTVYRVRLVSGIKDCAGLYFSEWNMASGFKTESLLKQVTAVTTPTNDNTPEYTFSSSVAGTITYGGSCSSNTTSATTDNNTITLNTLSDGTHSNCTIRVTDNTGNTSNTLTITPFIVDTTAPTVSSIVISSASGVQNSLLNAGDVVSVTSTFSENVTVTGTPQLTLVVGGTNRTATYTSGSGSTSLVYQYTIQTGETDSDGISIGTNALALNSGTIRDAVGNNATLTHSAVSANSSYKVDTTAPTANFTAATDDVGTVTGVMTSGNTTDDTAIVLSGTNESGSSVKVFNGSTELGSATVSGTSWSYSATVANGTTYQFNVKETDLAGNTSAATSNFAVIGDTTAPTLAETTLVPSLTNDNSTQYTFSSTEGGTISIGGSCSSDNNTAVADNMTVSFAALPDSTYSNCTITVTDSAGNSVTIDVNSFTIDTTAPTLSQVTAVSTPTNDNTSSYTFSSTEAGTISYSICGGNLDNASTDNNTITFNALPDGPYSDCKISVTDNASNTSDNLSVSSFTIDTVKPVLAQVTAVTTPTSDNTPDYTFSSTEAGTITYSGSCSSSTTSATSNNTVSLIASNGSAFSENRSYSDCTVQVTDNANNISDSLSVSSFTIDLVSPTVSSTSPENSASLVLKRSNIDLVFSESMDNSTIITNTSNTTCSGTLQVSSDNFSSCIQMISSPTSSNSNTTFTIDPSYNLSPVTTYKIRVTTGVKDTVGNTLGSQYETSSGFTTMSGVIVAVGDEARILTSVDEGTSWTSVYYDPTSILYGVTYGNGTYVAVGHNGTILTSTYGTSWDNRTSGTSVDFLDVEYVNDFFISVSYSGTIITSSDGISWTSRTSGTNRNLNGVTYGNGTLVAVGGTNEVGTGTIITSSDNGTSWTSRTSGVSRELYESVYGNGTFVVVGGSGTIITSSDNGTTWTSRTSDTSYNIKDVSYANGLFLAVGSTGTILTSYDGTSWDNSTTGSPYSMRAVTYAYSTYVATGGQIFTSSDNGTTWTLRTSGTSNTIFDLTYEE